MPKSSIVRDISPKYYTINFLETPENAYPLSTNVKGGANEYSEKITQFPDKTLWYFLQYIFQEVNECHGSYQIEHVSAIFRP